MKDALISIVNGNNKGYIYDCVASIKKHTQCISYDIVVIDNDTGDKRLSELNGMGVEVIINTKPLGFAQNHAQIVDKLSGFRNLILFNDDAFLENDAFSMMVQDVQHDDNKVAIAGCKIIDPEGDLQPSCAPFPSLSYFLKNTTGKDRLHGDRYSRFFMDYIDYNRTQYVDWVTGCCMLIDSNYIRHFGFMDVDYFMFLEDADICKTAATNGYKTKYISEALITHLGAGSSRDEKKLMKPVLYLETQRSRLRYMRKDSLSKYLFYFFFINIYLSMKLVKSVSLGRGAWASELVAKYPKHPLY